jgi:hypothetical protein
MRQSARITLFVQDRDGKADMVPDLEVLHLLLEQVPLVSRNPDGSRTLIFDLADPKSKLREALGATGSSPSIERLRNLSQALAGEARALGLTLTAAVAESAELLAEAEITSRTPPVLARA